MTDTLSELQRKMEGAGELKSVVRTMKAVSASNISQYEIALESLNSYFNNVTLGLSVTLGKLPLLSAEILDHNRSSQTIYAVVFGSDQGLVGQFNDSLAQYVAETLSQYSEEKVIWAVGRRVHGYLTDMSLKLHNLFDLPISISAIAPLIGQILVACEAYEKLDVTRPMYLFHNRPTRKRSYEPVCLRLLPLDSLWINKITEKQWPTNNLPEITASTEATLRALIREYLFVSLFKACAESLASENTSRLAAMQRAERNIGELLETFGRSFHHLRQSSIDEELLDLISGFEALKKPVDGIMKKIKS